MKEKPAILVLLLFTLALASSCEAVKDVLGESAGVDERFNDSSVDHDNRNTDDVSHNSCIKSSTDPDSLSLSTNLIEFYHFDEISGERTGVNSSINLNETGYVGSDMGVCELGLKASDQTNSNYLAPSTTSSLSFNSSQDFSIAFWAKVDPSSAGYQFIYGDQTDFYVAFYVDGSNDVNVEVWMGGASTIINETAVFSANGNWNHFAISLDRDTNSVFYFNGTQYYDSSTPSTAGSFTDVTNERIGHAIYTGNVDAVNGVIDEMGIWNKALTAGEVSKLYSKEYNF